MGALGRLRHKAYELNTSLSYTGNSRPSGLNSKTLPQQPNQTSYNQSNCLTPAQAMLLTSERARMTGRISPDTWQAVGTGQGQGYMAKPGSML